VRTLGSKANAARQLSSYGQLGGLKVEFAAGTKWYTSSWEPGDVSGSDLRKRVTSWGELSAIHEADARQLAQAAFSVAISDHDGELRALWEDEQFQRLPVEVHWGFWTPGEAQPTTSESVMILRGTLVPPISWSDGAREMQFEVVSLAARNSTMIGFHCTRERFPSIGEDEEGRAVPIVYGHPDKVRPVLTNGGARCSLAEGIADDTMEFTVDDSEGFPQDESIDIRVGSEIITGSFHGNTFTATARGKIAHSGTTTHVSPGHCSIRDTGLTSYADNAFVGYKLEITIDPYPYGNATPDGAYVAYMPLHTYVGTPVSEQLRDITRFVSSTGVVEFGAPYVLEGTVEALNAWAKITADEVKIKAGTSYKIRTIAEAHDAGAEVAEWAAPAQYAVGLSECSVRNVYVKGVRKLARTVTVLGPIRTYGGDASTIAEGLVGELFKPAAAVAPAWIPLPGELWTTDTVEESFGTYTRLTLRVPPTFMAGYELETDEIRVDVSGPEYSGDVIVNPADVIDHLFETYASLTAQDFSDAKSALSRWKMSFARADVVELNSFAAELAYRARCRIRWLGAVPELLFQACDGGAADLTVDRSRVILDSPIATREELERAASEITVSWEENGRLKKHTERDAAAEAAIGRRGVEIDCWCYDGIEWPRALARFILQRTRKLHDVALLDATAFAVAIEPGDCLGIDSDMSADWPAAPVKGVVLEAAHRQGSSPATPDAVGVRARLFRWAGCSLSCEGACETTGCETSCESYFEPDSDCWTCETSCEAACELGCTTAAEGLCGDAACEVSVTMGCALICQVSEMVGCGSCESYCQNDCESAGCQTSCEAVCMTACESACESACEAGCETGGET